VVEGVAEEAAQGAALQLDDREGESRVTSLDLVKESVAEGGVREQQGVGGCSAGGGVGRLVGLPGGGEVAHGIDLDRLSPPFGAHPLAFMMPSRNVRDRTLWAGAALRTVARRPSEPQS
jgi:hypothetical protein